MDQWNLTGRSSIFLHNGEDIGNITILFFWWITVARSLIFSMQRFALTELTGLNCVVVCKELIVSVKRNREIIS